MQLRHPPRLSARKSLEQLASCADDLADTPTWWQCVTEQLTAMRDELATQDIAALVDQVAAEFPERAIRATRTRLKHDDLKLEADRLARMMATRRGRRPSAAALRTELRRFVAGARKVDEQTDALLLDAYGLDIGVGD